MENNTKQYYTPELWEFCDGFEFESKKFDFVNGGYLWRNETYLLGREFYYPLKDMLENKEIRIKHLDREDIESLGFISVGDYEFRKAKLILQILTYKIDLPSVKKEETYYSIKQQNWDTLKSLYLGKIRNKFHLQQILKDIS